jgi:DNA-binding response OmpR family regulator
MKGPAPLVTPPEPAQESIFVIDDQPENLLLLEIMLRRSGFAVVTCSDPASALERCATHPPDLILLDISMPGMSGYEVCQRLKAHEASKNVPVIFMSALSQVKSKEQAFGAGGVDYITKPFQPEEVTLRIRNQLKIVKLQRQLELQNLELSRRNEELERSRRALEESHRRERMMFSALASALPGTVLEGKYRLDKKIGVGGFSTVYRGTHLTLNRPIAVKILQPRSGAVTREGLRRFRREGLSACRVSHPNAVAVYDSGVSETGIAYLVMELLRGRTLAQTLRASGRLSPQRCLEILRPVAEVLAKAHAVGIVHRDVKPDNIFLHRAGDQEVVKVVDFGLAKLFTDRTREGDAPTLGEKLIGTPAYMPPERLMQLPCDGQSDVYSLGVSLYEMLSGRPPFESADPWSVVAMHLTTPPPRLCAANPEISEAVAAVVHRALEKKPTLRPCPLELAEDFAAAVARDA